MRRRSITKWPPTLSLSRFTKHLSSSLEPSQPSYLAGISLELHLGGSSMALYKPCRTGCEGPVQSMSARSVKYECSVGPDHFALVSFTLVVQIRLYFGSDGNQCRLTPSLVVLLQPAATHLDGIIENNKLQTWQKTSGNFSLATLCLQCGALHVYDAYLSKCCVDRGLGIA